MDPLPTLEIPTFSMFPQYLESAINYDLSVICWSIEDCSKKEWNGVGHFGEEGLSR